MDSLDRLIDLALEEDLGAAGDITTRALISARAQGKAELWAKERMVLAGSEAFTRVFQRLDLGVRVKFFAQDGDWVGPRSRVAKLSGRLRSLLVGERTALNLIQRAAGIATLARAAVDAVGRSKVKILDTRKTPPGMRSLARAAVRAGGAKNHRFGLFDGVLIKDNHLAALGGSVSRALRLARERTGTLNKIEIEITSLRQLEEAIAEGADVVMLDNMSEDEIRRAVKQAAGRVAIELSGGITLERLPKLCSLGVDYISMGSLTHSARAMDLSLEIVHR